MERHVPITAVQSVRNYVQAVVWKPAQQHAQMTARQDAKQPAQPVAQMTVQETAKADAVAVDMRVRIIVMAVVEPAQATVEAAMIDAQLHVVNPAPAVQAVAVVVQRVVPAVSPPVWESVRNPVQTVALDSVEAVVPVVLPTVQQIAEEAAKIPAMEL